MKNILIFGALGLALYYGAKALKNPDKTEVSDDMQLSEIDQILKKYNGYQIVDKDGYWMVVKNGKLFSPADEAAFYAWQKNNPEKIFPDTVPVSVWALYSEKYYGGQFTATT